MDRHRQLSCIEFRTVILSGNHVKEIQPLMLVYPYTQRDAVLGLLRMVLVASNAWLVKNKMLCVRH